MRTRLTLLAFALVACQPTVAKDGKVSREVFALALVSPLCATPESFGAIVNDGLDDRVAIQHALDTGCAQLSAGTYRVTRHQETGTFNTASLQIKTSAELYGAGEGLTTVAMLGSGIRTGAKKPADWWLLGIFAPAHVHDLSFDGSERTNTSVQTHLIQVFTPAADVSIHNVSLSLPNLGPNTGGDCLRLLGTPLAWVSRVTIDHVTGKVCDRSFITVQRDVENLTIRDSESVFVGDTSIDFEPSAGATIGASVTDVTMTGLKLNRGPGAQGAYTVALSGDGDNVALDVVLRDSEINDGGVSVLDAVNVTLQNLVLTNRPTLNQAPTLYARKRIENLRLVNVTVNRLASSGPGSAIKIAQQSGVCPTDVTLVGVEVSQASDGIPVAAESLASLVVANSHVIYFGTDNTKVAFLARGITCPAGAPVIADTVVSGAMAGIATLAGVTNDAAPVVVRSLLTQ